MSLQGTIRRYALIIDKIGKSGYPNFMDIRGFLFEHGFEVSQRTIQRDIEQIRLEFGIDIIYDRSKNGYFINEENSLNLDSFLRFLELINTGEILAASLRESKDALKYISFESRGDLRWVENLKPLLFAIKNRRLVSLYHEKFDTGKKRKYTISPYLLKEYQGRWYLVGIIRGMSEFRTFGIDRVSGLEVMKSAYKPLADKNPSELFENTVGLTYAYNELEEVVLSFSSLQGKYAKTLPLHKSQEVIEDNEKETVIRLRIIPNYEFKQKILMFGETVKVLKPKWLVKEIRKSLQASLKNYR